MKEGITTEGQIAIRAQEIEFSLRQGLFTRIIASDLICSLRKRCDGKLVLTPSLLFRYLFSRAGNIDLHHGSCYDV
jgi:hypothetical protein